MDADEKLARKTLAKLGLPRDVKAYGIELGLDSTGDPALWIWLDVTNADRPTSAKVTRLRNFSDKISRTLLDEGVSRWPYVRLRAAA